MKSSFLRLLCGGLLAMLCSSAASAALIVNQASAWPSTPIVAGASSAQSTIVRDLRFTRDFAQSFQVTQSFVLGKAFIEYQEGIADKELTLKLYKVNDINARNASALPVQVGPDLLNLTFMTGVNAGTTGTLATAATPTIMEFQFSGADQITLDPLTGNEGYVFQLLRTGVGSTTDNTAERALKWIYAGSSVYSTGIMFERGINYSSDFSLAFEAAPIAAPEPTTLFSLGIAGIGAALFAKRRRAA